MWRASMRSFVRSQGFLDVDEESSAGWYKALMFQPKVIGVLITAGIAIQRLIGMTIEMLEGRPRAIDYGRSAEGSVTVPGVMSRDKIVAQNSGS